ncbi:MAG: alpha/beta hydrolase [Clostridia bacterium]|nr:alpha/beta hydrolase [Clostridia bacterium]
MKKTNIAFPSPVDGLLIDAVLAVPDGEVKGVIVMAHGVKEYKERYNRMMEIFTDAGFACAMNDHRGYGKSVKAASDYGYTYSAGAEGTVKDFAALEKMVSKRFPGVKVFLYGHSMGTLVALNHLKHASTRISGVVLSGLPANTPAAKAGRQFLKLRRRLKGDRFMDESARKLMFSAYDAKFKDENLPNAWLNSDKAAVKAYNDDPLSGGCATVDGYMSLIDLLIGAYSIKEYRLVSNLLPIDIFVGEFDPCAGFASGAEKSLAFLKKVGFVKTNLHVLKGMRHEIHNEPGGEEVMKAFVKAFTDSL